uniref:Regulator of microtubule dynamics protein 3 n=1 Tax=Oryzias latipes TaxID=8090 RepID=A0A3P9MEV9_ORYLA
MMMSIPLGRNGWIGLAAGATAGLGLIAFIIYKEIRRTRTPLEPLSRSRAAPQPLGRAGGGATPQEPLDHAQEMEAQQQALAAVEAVVKSLSPQQELELRKQLDQVLGSVASLRSEVAELRGGLQDIALQIIQDIKKGVEDNQRIRRRRQVHRDRTDSASSSSIYFTASQGMSSTCEETSEGGYSTAYADSDFTDREEADKQPESEEEEDQSCATVLTLRQEDSPEEEPGEDGVDEEEDDDEEENEGSLQQPNEVPSGELALLLAQSDILHTGDASLKAEGFRLLLDNRAEHGHSREFLWRLARAYVDVYFAAQDKQERMSYAQKGRDEAEAALKRNGLNAECHKWLAVLSSLSAEHDSTHSKLKSGFLLKEHLDRALRLRDDDPVCYFLLGRWCFEVASLDWLEKKAAAALYRSAPTSSLHDALENFLKAEELSPGFSRTVRLYIAMCHKELGNISEATNWAELALNTASSCDEAPTNAAEARKLEAELRVLTDGNK